MRHIKLKKGLDLQLAGSPEQKIFETIETDTVAITSDDFRALQPEFSVQVGDSVEQGQTLFVDRHNPQLRFTSPIKGTIETIETGRRRTLDTMSIRRHSSEESTRVPAAAPANDRESVQALLLDSGLWTALRTRPFNRVPVPGTVPADIFVTAMDSNPLAADPRVVLIDELPAFKAGLAALPKLTDGSVYVCQRPGSPLAQMKESGIIDVAFSGPHPAGLAGTHIHFLAPVSRERMSWYVDYQDIIALGHLISSGRLQTTLPVPLLRALALGNLEQAESLGCLELSEEDVDLFSWVCPSQSDYADLLRACLARTAEEVT